MAEKEVDTTDEEKLLREAADKEGAIEVPIEAKEPDDDEAPETEEKPEKISRDEKKRRRGQDLVRQAKEEAEQARREAAELRGRMEELARQTQQQFQRQQQPQKDPLDTELENARREYNAYVTRYQNALQKAGAENRSLTPQEMEAYEKEGWDLKDRMDDIGYRRAAKRHQQPGPSAEDMQRQALVTQVRTQHGDLTGNDQANRVFMAHWQLLLAEGKPDTFDTMNLAADKARSQLGMPPRGGRPAPTAVMKRRLSAQPQSGGGSEESDSRPLVMTKELKRMADAALGHIKDQKKRYETFARTTGKELRKDGLA